MKNPFLNAQGKIRSIWWVPIFFFLLAIFLFPIILIAKEESAEIPIFLQAALLLVVTLICQLLRRKSIFEITGQFNLIWIKQLLIGLGIGAILMIVPALVLTVLGYASWTVNDLSLTTAANGIFLFIGVAIAEELLFRGFLFQRLIDALGQWPAQLILAGMFLLTHLNNPGMEGVTKTLASLNIFIASLLFGLAYLKTKSLAMPIGLHLMANFMQGTILGFGVSGAKEQSLFTATMDNCPTWLSGGSFGIEASALGLISVILLTVLMYRRTW